MAALCPACGCRDMYVAFGRWHCRSCDGSWKVPVSPAERREWWVGFIGSFVTVLVLLDIIITLMR